MKNWILMVILAPVLVFSKAERLTSSSGELRSEFRSSKLYGRNFLGLELLGRGGGYSLNYDRAINPRFSAGGGFSYYQLSGVGLNYTISVLPIYMNYYLGGPTHRAFFTGGGSAVFSQIEIFDSFYADSTAAKEDNEIAFQYARVQGSSFYPNAGVGYEFRTRGGFTARTTAYLTYITNRTYQWIGATLGAHF